MTRPGPVRGLDFLRGAFDGGETMHASVWAPADPPACGRWRDGDLVLDRATPRGASRTVLTLLAEGYRSQKLFRPPEAGSGWQPVQDARLADPEGNEFCFFTG